MNLYYYILLTIFAIIAYMIAVDKNVATFIDLMIRYAWVQLKRAWWIIRFHPANPIPRWTLNWRIERMTRQLEKRLNMERNRLTDQDQPPTM